MRYSKLHLISSIASYHSMSRVNRLSVNLTSLLTISSINLALAISIGLGGCSTTQPKEPEAKELVAASSKATDAPEQELLKEAQRHFASGLYSVARESFERLRDSYPSGSYREFAEIKIADCYFEAGSYDDASRRYEEFYRNYPASSSVTYAIFKAARSHQLAFRGVGRDPSPLERSLEIYNNLLSNYPENSLTEAAKGFKAEVLQLLAEGERNVSEFYSAAGKEDAAEVRLSQFEKKQRELRKQQPKIQEPDSTSTEIAGNQQTGNEEDDGESEKTKKRISQPQVVSAQAAVKNDSVNNSLDSENRIVEGKGKRVDKSSALTRNKTDSNTTTETESDLTPSSLKITRLDCKESGERSVVFFLSRPIPNAESINQSFTAQKRVLDIKLPVEESAPAIRSCFGDRDLAISDSGELTIRGPSGADLIALNHPPRMVLVLRYPPARPKFTR